VKFMTAQFTALRESGASPRNLRLLARFILLLLLMVLTYAVLFHVLMAAEGQEHSWVTGFYWTLVTMSTLGFGDITFQSDIGRVFSMLVVLSGVVFLLIVLPFTFIEFFYSPWLDAQRRARAPRHVPEDVEGHVIISNEDPVALALVERLRSYGRQYYVLEPDLNRALELYDQGLSVVLGERDDMQTYKALRAHTAAMVVATADD
jgi:voltage-gated potassium channel